MITILIENPLVAALYGWVVGNFWLLTKSKDPLDDQGKKWSFSVWIESHWDNTVFTFLLIPFFVAANEWVFTLIFSNVMSMDIEYHPLFNACIMPVYQIIYKKARGK